MCGIVGYTGAKKAAPILIEGLTGLEYRGYDSSGVAVLENGQIKMVKAKGRLKNLVELTDNGERLPGTVGIGHTRWATHGEPSDVNSHPYTTALSRTIWSCATFSSRAATNLFRKPTPKSSRT